MHIPFLYSNSEIIWKKKSLKKKVNSNQSQQTILDTDSLQIKLLE